MALQRAQITPSISEKRYNTLNFLEASVMQGNLVKISQVDNYTITSLSGEIFTYKEPIETYLVFDTRPSVKLLRKYGWYREDQEILPVIAYIPTHLLYDKHKLEIFNNYTNKGIPSELIKEGETIILFSPDLKYHISKTAAGNHIVYQNNTQNYNSTDKDEAELVNVMDVVLPKYVTQETLLELHHELSTLEDDVIHINPYLTTLVETEFDKDTVNFNFNTDTTTLLIRDNTHNKLIDLNTETTLNLGELSNTEIITVIYNGDKVLIETNTHLKVMNQDTKPYSLLKERPTADKKALDYKGELILLTNTTTNKVEAYDQDFNRIGLPDTYTEAVLSPDGKNLFALTQSADMIYVYTYDENILNYSYMIPLGDTSSNNFNIVTTNNHLYLTSRSNTNNNYQIFKAFEYLDNNYIEHSELIINITNLSPNSTHTELFTRGDILYLLDNENGLYAKIEASTEENLNKAVANFVLLTGNDIQPIIETGESENFILKPLEIIRGTLIDINYDFVENAQSKFYVTDSKVDTVSVNYVVNLMPYKDDQQPYGEEDSSTSMFTTDTRDIKL